MKPRRTLNLPAILTIIAALATTAWCEGEFRSKSLSFDQLPAVVRASVKKEAPGAAVKDVCLVTEDNKKTYLIETNAGGKRTVLEMAEDGRLLNKNALDENPYEAVPLDKLPPVVKASIEKAAGRARIYKVTRLAVGDKTTYVATALLDKEGLSMGIEVDEDGRLIRKDTTEEEVSVAKAPPPVKATLNKEAPRAKVKSIRAETHDGKSVYTVEALHKGKRVALEIAETGTLLSKEEEVTLGEVPRAAREAFVAKSEGVVWSATIATKSGRELWGANSPSPRVRNPGLIRMIAGFDAEGNSIHILGGPDLKVGPMVRRWAEGKTQFEFEVSGEGVTVRIVLDPDGKVLDKSVEEE